MSEAHNTRIADGVAQEGRMLPALEYAYFNVDEMSTEDLLSMSVDFAASIKYYNLELKESGNWRAFLAANELVIMSMIISKDTDELALRFLQMEKLSLSHIIEKVYLLVAEVDSWFASLKLAESESGKKLSMDFEEVISQTFIVELHNLGLMIEYMNTRGIEFPAIRFEQLGKVWGVKKIEGAYHFPRATLPQVESVEEARASLRVAADTLVNGITHLKRASTVYLPEALKTQAHDPAVGLFIAFLKLYQHAQNKINAFTQRHLDFYYQDILKARLKDKALESAFLTFELAGSNKPLVIEQGMQFTNGKDAELNEIVFEALDDLVVSDAEVAALYTLRFQRDSMIAPECDMNFVTRIHRNKIKQLPFEVDKNELPAWPLFGAAKQKSSFVANGEAPIEMGIAIASPVLFLAEGERTIELSVFLTQKDEKPEYFYLEALLKSESRQQFFQCIHELIKKYIREEGLVLKSLLVKKRKELERIASQIDQKTGAAKADGNIVLMTCREILRKCQERILALDISLLKVRYFIAHLADAQSSDEFRERLGMLVVDYVLEQGGFGNQADDAFLSFLFGKSADQHWQNQNGFHSNLPYNLSEKALQLNCRDSLDRVLNEIRKGRGRLFNSYFKNAFIAALSTESGWLEINRCDVDPLPRESIKDPVGFKVTLAVASESQPVVACISDVHGSQWNTDLPLIKLNINSQATFNIYSMFQDYTIKTLDLAVHVKGARNIVSYNNLSQLDPSKPFYPFGPLPTTNSYFAFALAEAAKKTLTSFKLNLEWGDLPKGPEGFAGHYAGYASKFDNSSFEVDINVLKDGRWEPVSSERIQKSRLFDSEEYVGGRGCGRVKTTRTIAVKALDYFKPVFAGLKDEELDLGLKSKNGFVKLTLSEPSAAFGHKEHPEQLSRMMMANSKLKKLMELRTPQTPYTPVLNKVSVDYSAKTSITLGLSPGNNINNYDEKVFRLHPFRSECIYPGNVKRALHLFPQHKYDGNLFIGLSASMLKGPVSLYFSLRNDADRSVTELKPQLFWSYMTDEGWVEFSAKQVISDSTHGFLRSGIVILDIPDDITRKYAQMPEPLYWLSVAADRDQDSFCSMCRIKTHAVQVRRSASDHAIFLPHEHNPRSLDWQPVVSIAGLGEVRQFDDFLDTGIEDNRKQLVTRVSERLRHRYRAITPWDYERLVLEEFPNVGKVKCFANSASHTRVAKPGQLLVVAVPRINTKIQNAGLKPSLSAIDLERIHEFVSGLNSGFAKLEVRNPIYEWIQVRCRVVFEKSISGGQYAQVLNQEISQYLSPWHQGGYPLKFGWQMKPEDVFSYIYGRDYIRYVTDFSMLHLTEDAEGLFRLGDTARDKSEGINEPLIRPMFPWSIALPLKNHFIESALRPEPKEPNITGIGELEIGSTLIIGGSIANG